MFKLTILVVSICITFASSKRLTRSVLNNEIESNSGYETFDQNWVTIKPKLNEVETLVGKPVELECEASGSPAPSIQFYSDASELLNDGTLSNIISDFSKTALVKAKARLRFIARKSEVIFCKARAGSKTAQAAIKIFVTGIKMNLLSNDIWEYKSKEEFSKLRAPRITYFDTMYLDEIGNTAILPCVGSGSGRVETVWLNATENVIENGGNKRLTVSPYGDLEIRNMHWSDMGPYTCIVKNNYGQDTITTFLYPMANE